MEDNAGRRAALGKGAPREPSSARQDTIEEPEDALKSRHQGLPHHEVPLWSLNVKTKQTGSPQAQPAQGGLLPLPWTQGWCPTKSQRVDWMSPKAPKAKTLKPQGPGIEHRVPTSSSFQLASSCSYLGLLQKTPVRCQYLSSKWGDKHLLKTKAPLGVSHKLPEWQAGGSPTRETLFQRCCCVSKRTVHSSSCHGQPPVGTSHIQMPPTHTSTCHLGSYYPTPDTLSAHGHIQALRPLNPRQHPSHRHVAPELPGGPRQPLPLRGCSYKQHKSSCGPNDDPQRPAASSGCHARIAVWPTPPSAHKHSSSSHRRQEPRRQPQSSFSVKFIVSTLKDFWGGKCCFLTS